MSPAVTDSLSSASGDEITNPPGSLIVQMQVAGADTLPAWSDAVTLLTDVTGHAAVEMLLGPKPDNCV